MEVKDEYGLGYYDIPSTLRYSLGGIDSKTSRPFKKL